MERKDFLGLSISELGVGTYLGDLDQATSEGYKQVIVKRTRGFKEDTPENYEE
jgi:hypothetical protein